MADPMTSLSAEGLRKSPDAGRQHLSWPTRASASLAVGRIAGLVGLTLGLLLVNPVGAIRKQGFPRWIVERWHSGCCRIAGITPKVRGEIVHDRPVLFVANHVSYLDITVLGSVLEGSFVAKSEVKGWPVFGYLAQLQRTVFVERRGKHAHSQREHLKERLAAGDSLILFPEGTSSDGTRALRFKSALFDAATIDLADGPVEVQPISIAYTRLDGMPMGRMLRPFYAWYGDMELAPHLWRALGLGNIEVDIVVHPPVRLADFGSRKALAQHCETVVSRGLSDALAGRYERDDAPRPAGYDGFDLPGLPKSA